MGKYKLKGIGGRIKKKDNFKKAMSKQMKELMRHDIKRTEPPDGNIQQNNNNM